jgi:hypothetical protein
VRYKVTYGSATKQWLLCSALQGQFLKSGMRSASLFDVTSTFDREEAAKLFYHVCGGCYPFVCASDGNSGNTLLATFALLSQFVNQWIDECLAFAGQQFSMQEN